MKAKPRFPLLARMLVWLCLHLVVLAVAFGLFVSWQLRLGLDSFLSAAAGERLAQLGESMAMDLRGRPESTWPDSINERLEAYGLEGGVKLQNGDWVSSRGVPPDDALARLPRPFRRGQETEQSDMDPLMDGDGGFEFPPEGDGMGPPRPRGGPPGRPRRPAPRPGSVPKARPLFLMKSQAGDYWAGIDLALFRPGVDRPLHGVLFLRSADLSGGGLFFELRPWLMGGLAVLALSLLVWAPFVLGITRYARRLSRATDAVAEGRFDVRIRGRRSDELGSVGRSIERMAARLDGHVKGQKRFLGDVAHELCSPLARIRTGLGVLEHGLDPEHADRLASIDEDVAELSELVSEVLAFSKASVAPESVKLESVELLPLVERAVERECPGHRVDVDVPEVLSVEADKRLLDRAIANLLRNAHRHGGESCSIRVSASAAKDRVLLNIEDDGPGVAEEALPHLFEPFFRPDESRARSSGGAGLGLAIVASAAAACGGSVEAWRRRPSGLVVILDLPRSDSVPE